jgi:hypothetical protein
MFFIARLLVMFVAGLIWRTTRRVEWFMRTTPWLSVISFLVTLLTLVSLVLEIVIRIKSF